MFYLNPNPEIPSRASSFVTQRWGVVFLALLLLIPPVGAFAEDPKPLPAVTTGTPAENTSFKQFPQNLGKNFLALLSRKNILPLLIGGAASGIVAPFDEDIRDRVGAHGDSSTFGKIGSVIGGPAVVISTVAGFFIGGHYSKNDRFHSFTYALAQGTVINEALVQGLKVAIGRTRPDGSDNMSFPSGHAATSFMIATVVQRYYGRTAGIISYSAAAFITLSRVRENKHWASDLTAGATLGYIVGSSVCRRTGISLRVGKVTLVPAFDLQHRIIRISLLPDF
jgi:membrane-associated phospholipid phosphatase